MAAPHSLPPHAILRLKTALRARARALRAALDPALGAVVARLVLDGLPLAPGAAVAGTWPMGDEIDLRPLWHALHGRGHTVLLPETTPRGQALIFRAWVPGAAMIPERFGTMRPEGPVGTPVAVIVPFLAFDRAGHRLGYGGGYYDRTLAALPGVPAIGAGFAALQVDSLPVGPHDRALDAIFTEHGREFPPAKTES
jgi:5-formyltetrahydrofolate cyclo-ligase